MDNVVVAHLVFGIFGNVSALFLFLSPVFTFRRIVKKRSTEEFSGVPYNMTLLNCLLSAWYGLPFVSPNNTLVWTINGTGTVLEVAYVTMFLVFARKDTRAKMAGLLALVCSVFAAVALVSLLVLHGENGRKVFCGTAASVFSICMYASPLAVMRLVIETKSVEFMPFPLSLFSFLCGTSWFIYGILGRDVFIMVPNGCGSALGAAQLILYAMYRKNKGPGKTAVASGDTAEAGDAKQVEIEMGGGGGGGAKAAQNKV
ncbi:bidirectional sugar transporter SWEET1a isoform X1 [Iris pallida]|uniref:Bidirectional sugar transporter SWEET n=1 Tax=Iris pallida TaxID=29817 RepID=A0AAX6EGW7_IRIPA|nr:bidirectional sugar transporter SWEET1a isoform X1 [Iris pallida]